MSFLNNATFTEVVGAYEVTFCTGVRPQTGPRPCSGLAYAIDGELTYIHRGGEQRLDREHIVLLPKGSYYNIKCTKAGRFAIINFQTAEWVDDNLFESFRVQSAGEVYLRQLHIMQKLLAYDSANCRAALFASLYKIASAILLDTERRGYPAPLYRAMKYIDENLCCAQLKNSDIAAYVGLSEVYVRKLFTQNLDTPLKEYVRARRIELARTLLNDTAKSVTEIAEDCGFSGIYHFCRAFKNAVGMTPGEYRGSNRSFDF